MKQINDDDMMNNYDAEVLSDIEERISDDVVRTDEVVIETKANRIVRKPKKFDDYVMLTYTEAVNGDDKQRWLDAINDEKKSLLQNRTWDYIDIKSLNSIKPLTSRWIFKIKDDGRYKARLVIRGCEQNYGVDYNETFSPVISTSSLRILLALASKKETHIITFDIKTAFLNGELDEDVYMYPPEGFEIKNKICKLNKTLYGLKQSSLKWNQCFSNFLQQNGFESLQSEQCIFKNKNNTIFIAIYVDDGLIIGQDENEMSKILNELDSRFGVTKCEHPTSFLGMKIKKTSDILKVSQPEYTKNLLIKYGMQDSKPVYTPILKSNETEDNNKTNFPIREAVGSLLYLSTKTRPDICFAINHLSTKVENPTKESEKNIKRILRYINGTQDYGIVYQGEASDDEIIAYCDSDYAGDVNTRKSTTGYLIIYRGGVVSWCSRKQSIIALSSTEAEYIAAAECCKELLHIKSLLEELTGNNMKITLNVDNQSAISLIKNSVTNKRSKHIDVKYHFINELVKNKIINIIYCPTEKQLADMLTKPVSPQKLQNLIETIVM